MNEQQMRAIVDQAVADVKILDLHTHLYSQAFGDLMLCGVDELLTYHYLIAETFRYVDMDYDSFFSLDRTEQADLIFDTLFVQHTPVSEACRGVVTTLRCLGAPVGKDLAAIRTWYDVIPRGDLINRIFAAAHVSQAVMTNDPFDDGERAKWMAGVASDPRFLPALRLDMLLLHYEEVYPKLQQMGYAVTAELTEPTLDQIRQFVEDWAQRMGAVYMAVSLPDSFHYPDDTAATRMIDACIIPVCRKWNLPFAMMIGVRRGVNPGLRMAGDGVAKADSDAVANLCSRYPDCKFMLTMLARENQHEICVLARKFRNLLVFGCWWFLNNPSLIDEMTRMRLEMLGTSIIPQHSDARIMDQLVYKWSHSRAVIGRALKDQYAGLLQDGWPLTEADIRKDVELLFGGAWKAFTALQLA